MQEEIEKIKKENFQLNDQIKLLQKQFNEREQIYSNEKIQYEKRIKDFSKRPIMTCVKLQTVNIFSLKKIFCQSYKLF